MRRPTVDMCKQYGLAAILAAGALALHLLLDPILHGRAPFLFFTLAILGSAAYGGLGPGLACTALSAAATAHIWLEPAWSWRVAGLAGVGELILLIAVGIGISLISAALRSARGAAIAAMKDRDASQRVADVLSSITDSFFAVDRHWRVVDINAKAADYVGRPAEQLRGRILWDVVPQLADSPLGRQMRQSAEDQSIADLEMLSVVRPGCWIEVHIRPSPEGLSVFFRDITARKRTEQALRISEDRLRLAAEAANIGMWYRDLESDQVIWTERGKALFGLGPDADLSFARFLERIHPDDRQRTRDAILAALNNPGGPIDLEYRIVRPDGDVRWIMAKGRSFNSGAGRPQHTYGVMVDITALKTIEIELQEAKAAAERANAAKDQFLAVLSHELRTPLTPVLAVAGILQRDDRLSPDARADAEMICRNVQLETRLIDDLLDLTRISRGKLKLEQQTVDVCTVLRQAMEICSADADAKDLRVSLDIHNGQHRVRGDSSRLQQVFWNLAKNAIKFTPPGGSLSLRCFATAADSIIVEVTDSGIGIEPQFLARIFDAFDQGDRAVTREFGGLGLGLSISKALVEMHGGSISATSSGKNRGATFRVELPAESVPQCIEPASGPLPPALAPSGDPNRNGQLQILLVEDHADTARIMSRLLSNEGHTVHLAGSVAAALDVARSRPISLLISDLGLPDGSGVDLMRTLRAEGLAIRGIALSGFGRPEDIDRSHDAGFVEHLVKPVNFDHLCAAIGRVMGPAVPVGAS